MPPTPRQHPRLPLTYLIYCASNLIGLLMMFLINLFTPLEIFAPHRAFIFEKGWVIGLFLFPAVFGAGLFLLSRAQRPITDWLSRQAPPGSSVPMAVRRRVLNLPFAMAAINLTMWICVSGLIGLFFLLGREAHPRFTVMIVFRGVMVGLISSSLSFFFLERIYRGRLAPLIFSESGPTEVPRAFRVSIAGRIRLLYGSGTINPMLLLVGTLASILWEARERMDPAAGLLGDILLFTLVLYGIFVVVALGLNFLAGRSILEPVRDLMGLVKRVRGGDFDSRVTVVANDELGVLGSGMNDMAAGLGERERLLRSLNLAKEVQQALLPEKDPQIEGLDVAGISRYCDETGGDYFDYLPAGRPGPRQLSVVVGDVSGHGISAALLMTSCRAYLRQRAAAGGRPGAIVGDVNRQLARDVEESGSFTTLFFLRLELGARALSWVRAGHEPAIFYDPAADAFDELRGEGPALGMHADWDYTEGRRERLAPGSIVVVGTDGIFEARKPEGEMFGRQRLCEVVRRHRQAGARQIVAACLAALDRFRGQARSEDDETLIVIKIVDVTTGTEMESKTRIEEVE